MSDHPAVEVRGLIKEFQTSFRGPKLRAVDDVSLSIEPGEVYGLIGPNGSGKSTTMKALLGLLKPTSGRCSIFGKDSLKVDSRNDVGFLPENPYFYKHLTGAETVKFYGKLCGMRGDRLKRRVDEMLELVGLDEARNRRLGGYSKGMLQRIGLAQALVQDPRLVVLDEPTAGVDVELRQDMWRIVERLRQSGVTIILTTHYIEEAEAIADRVAVIAKGEILLVEEKFALMSSLGQKELKIELQHPCDAIPESLGHFDLERSSDGLSLTYRYEATGERTGITRLLNDLAAAGLQMKDLETKQSSLEEIFVGLVKDPT